jgi:DNA-directed RNA polymerase subunit RPC12/RpoP
LAVPPRQEGIRCPGCGRKVAEARCTRCGRKVGENVNRGASLHCPRCRKPFVVK